MEEQLVLQCDSSVQEMNHVKELFERVLILHPEIIKSYNRFSTFIIRHGLGFTLPPEGSEMTISYNKDNNQLTVFEHVLTDLSSGKEWGYRIDFSKNTFDLIKRKRIKS